MRKHPFLFGFTCMVILCMIFVLCLWVLGQLGALQDVVSSREKIAVIEVEGVIVTSRDIISRINKYKEDESIKAVVIRIDSPGGGVGPSQEIYEEVNKLGKKKQVVASMGSVAASGGYYIACATHKIFANPGTITGSIGVIIEFANVEELLGKIGMKSVVIKSGKYKDILSPTREIKEDEQALLQGVIDSIHRQFIEDVARGRKLPVEKVKEIADGRIFSGEQALELGLLDELGNLQDAIQAAADLVGIEGKPRVVYPEKKKPSIWEFVFGGSLSNIRELLAVRLFNVGYLLQYDN